MASPMASPADLIRVALFGVVIHPRPVIGAVPEPAPSRLRVGIRARVRVRVLHL